MKIFVTGATGFVGGAVTRELLAAGHAVVGLARSERSAEELKTLGATAHRGELSDIDALTSGARDAEAVLHIAMDGPERDVPYKLDPNAYVKKNEIDRAAIKALVAAKKPLVVTSGTAIASSGKTATETDGPTSDGLGAVRGPAENIALESGATVLRLPLSVHGPGDRGFLPGMIAIARKKGFSAYVDGVARWPAVHRLDAARLYRLAIENAAKLAGKRVHGVGEGGVSVRAIAEAIGAGLGVPVKSIAANEAPDHFEWLARFVGMDLSASSATTRALLDWAPREAGLLDDLNVSGYFQEK